MLDAGGLGLGKQRISDDPFSLSRLPASQWAPCSCVVRFPSSVRLRWSDGITSATMAAVSSLPPRKWFIEVAAASGSRSTSAWFRKRTRVFGRLLRNSLILRTSGRTRPSTDRGAREIGHGLAAPDQHLALRREDLVELALDEDHMTRRTGGQVRQERRDDLDGFPLRLLQPIRVRCNCLTGSNSK